MLQSGSEDILRKILSTAKSLKTLVGSSQSQPSTLPQPIDFEPLNLLFPHDITRTIDSLGLPNESSQKLKQLVTRSILRSQQLFLQSYERTCRDLPRSPHASNTLRKLGKILRDTYEQQHVGNIRQKILDVQISLTKQKHIAEGRKPSFNTKYTPLLENYFEHNAYPSSQDRHLLAQKTMMTPRQIEVWFQNHRTRSKGKILKRSASGIPLDALSITLDGELPSPANESEDTSPCDEESDYPVSDNETPRERSILDDDFIRPCHAFPIRYPPHCVDDPFPNVNGIFNFPPPVWQRTPAKQSKLPKSIDMDSLTTLFNAKLTLRDGSPGRARKCSISDRQKPWFASRITVALRAPHPALVLNCWATSTTKTAPSTFVHACKESSDVSFKPSPSAKEAQVLSRQRKSKSGISHPVGHSSSRWETYASRPPPLSKGRNVSWSSCSSGPSTPPQSPVTNPRLHDLSLTPQDFQVLDQLFASDPFLDMFENPVLSSYSDPKHSLFSCSHLVLPSPNFVETCT